MSIARAASRICAIQAITNKTWAEDKVFDSEIGVIEQVHNVDYGRAPFIVVYTDDFDIAVDEKRGLLAEAPFSLVFEIAIQSSTAKTDDPDRKIIIGPESDSTMELMLDMVERQVRVALSDPDNAWTQLLMRIAPQWRRLRSVRASEGGKTRFAARQLSLEVIPIKEPGTTGSPFGVWPDLLTAMDESGKGLLEDYATIFRDALSGRMTADDPDDIREGWKAVAQRYGLSVGAAGAFGISSFEDVGDDTDLEEINVDVAPEDEETES